MKTLSATIGCLLMTTGIFAHAEPLTIMLAEHDQLRPHNPQAQFEINPDLGRAWVIVSFERPSLWEEPLKTYQRVKVEALRFDLKRNAIVLSLQDREVICATVRERRRLGSSHYHIQPTKACRLETVINRELVDDGFFIKQQNVARTKLHVSG